MITLEESIPTKNETYKVGLDIFYTQFNDVSFYIEDEEQENFFYSILVKIFPDISIQKIFPLGGKENVINECKRNIGDIKKVYIVDKDFDDFFDRKEDITNLFYLDRYSIENYLIEKESIINYIVSERPKLKKAEVEANLKLQDIIRTIRQSLNNIIYHYLVVQFRCPRLKNISIGYERFLRYSDNGFSVITNQIQQYENEIHQELQSIDRRLTVNGQIKKIREKYRFLNNDDAITHMPGKYLIKMIKQLIESLFGLVSRNMDSFCYRIADKCSFNSLQFLHADIRSYIDK